MCKPLDLEQGCSESEQKEPFLVSELGRLLPWLESLDKWRDLAILVVAVESMLRVCDLRKLRVKDVWDGQRVKTKLVRRQQKTKRLVYPGLHTDIHRYVQKWIEVSGKKPNDYLFTSFHPAYRSCALSDDAIRKMVKNWAAWLGKDPVEYGAHSLRRTKTCWLFEIGIKIEEISEMLGHSDIRSTMRYLGISRKKAQATALRYSIFGKGAPKIRSVENTVQLSDAQLKRLAKLVAKELSKQSTD